MRVWLLLMLVGVVIYAAIEFWVSSDRRKRIFGIISVIVGAVLMCPVLCSFTYMVGSDALLEDRLDGYASKFHRFQHPSDTSLVTTYQTTPRVGANECEYFVGELREYSGDNQGIIEFYTNQEREEPFSNHTYVVFLEDGRFTESIPVWREAVDWDVVMAEHAISSSHYWGLVPSALEGRLYIIYFSYGGGPWDYTRCP